MKRMVAEAHDVLLMRSCVTSSRMDEPKDSAMDVRADICERLYEGLRGSAVSVRSYLQCVKKGEEFL